MASNRPDKFDFLDEVGLLSEDELEQALTILLNSFRYHNKYEEAVCLKALIHSIRNKKQKKMKTVCLTYLSAEDPETKKLIDKHVEDTIDCSGLNDVDFLSSVGVENDQPLQKINIRKSEELQ